MSKYIKKRILLVEDEALLAMNEKMQLEKYGYAVRTVNTGEKAVEAVQTSTDIDLILMDINLGNGIDGTEAAEIILQDHDIPIVFLSSHTDPDIVEKTEKITSYGYVVKNSNIAVLDASIKMAFKLLELRRLADDTFTHSINGFCVHRLIRDESGNIHDCEYLRVNSAYERHTMLRSQDIIGRTIRDIYPGSEADEVIHLYDEILSGRADARQEFYFEPTLSWYEMSIFGTQEDEFTVAVHNITERKQTEDELKRFKTISDNAVYGKAIADLEGYLLYVNRFFANVHGYEPEELVGKHLSVFHNEQQRDEVSNLNATLFREGSYQPAIVGHCHKDGTEFPMLMSGLLLNDGNGTPQYIAASAVDVTERERLVTELREERELATRIIEDGPVAITQVDRDGNVIFANSDAQQLLGLAKTNAEDLSYNSPEWLITDIDGNPFPDERLPFRQVISTDQAVYNVQHAINRLGTRKILSINGAPLHDEHGRIDRVVLAIQDITDRKRIEQDLTSQKQYLETILETTVDGFWVVAPNGRITSVNTTYCRMSGYSADELTSMEINDLDAIENPEQTAERIRRIMENGSETFETKHRRKDGSVFDVEVSASRLNQADGVHVFAFCRDITERKIAEKALRKNEEELKKAQAITHIGTWYLDTETNYVTWTEELYKMYGFDPKKPVPPYTEHMKLFTPESWELLSTSLAKTRDTGIPYELELQTVRNDRSNGWMWVQGKAVFDENGTIIGLWGAAQDITDRKNAERDLQTISKMQSIILKMASDYINKSSEQVDETINDSLKEIGEFVKADRAYVFEYDWVKDVANNTYEWCNAGVNPEIDNLQGVPNTVIHYWVEAHRNGKEISILDVMQLPLDDGVRKVLESQGVKSVLSLPIMSQGACIGFVGFDSVRETKEYSEAEKTLLKVFSEMLVNIGHRKELEEELVHAKERAEENGADLIAIVEGATESIWSFDENYDIRYINDLFRNDFHAAFGVWLDKGSNLVDALPEPLRPIWKPRYDKMLSNEQFIVTDEVDTVSGKRFIQVSFNPIVHGDRVIGGSCFASNITDRKIAEIEIQKQLDEKEMLLREVHHRVKNNMGTIESLLSLQIGSTAHAEVKVALQDTISRVQSTRVLYDKLLVSDNLNEVSVQPYANGLIDAIVRVFDLENPITIERDIADFVMRPKEAFILGIIINELLTNVFKYAFKDHASGEASVFIGKEESTVTLIVQDNGVGFDERALENKSPGFGLTVVKMLVEQAGGTYGQSNDNGAKSVVRFGL